MQESKAEQDIHSGSREYVTREELHARIEAALKRSAELRAELQPIIDRLMRRAERLLGESRQPY